MTPIPASFEPYLSKEFSCRLCGGKMRMIRTENNKSMPVDSEPITVTDADLDEGLPIRLIDAMGRSRIHLPGEVGFMTHFATCPNYNGSMPKPKQWSTYRAPNPTRRSMTHMIDRLTYIDEALARIHKLHKRQFDAKVFLNELGHLRQYVERTKAIITEE